MVVVLYFCALISITLGSISEDSQETINQYQNTNDGQGNYVFSFRTANGIFRRETGKVVNIGKPNEHIKVEGILSYKGLDGKQVKILYTAGENGYQLVDPDNLPSKTKFSGVPPKVIATLLGK